MTDDDFTPEQAVTELRRAWLDVLASWDAVARDDVLMDDLRAVRAGIELKTGRVPHA